MGKKETKREPPPPSTGVGGKGLKGEKVEDARAARPFTAGELKNQGRIARDTGRGDLKKGEWGKNCIEEKEGAEHDDDKGITT